MGVRPARGVCLGKGPRGKARARGVLLRAVVPAPRVKICPVGVAVVVTGFVEVVDLLGAAIVGGGTLRAPLENQIAGRGRRALLVAEEVEPGHDVAVEAGAHGEEELELVGRLQRSLGAEDRRGGAGQHS